MIKECDDMLSRLDKHTESCQEKHEEYIRKITKLEADVEGQTKMIDALFRELRIIRWAMVILTPLVLGIVSLEEYIHLLLNIGG